MRATWAIWVGASLAVLGWWSRLPAAGRILTVAEGREILGDAFALGIARAERTLDARRASGETSAAGGGASVSSLVVIQGGSESPCVVGCDSNSDGRDDIADAVFTLNHLFLGGPQPEGPFP